MIERTVDVLIVGAGPAGLAAATALARAGAGRVEVLERELEPGGIPRHSHHTGFGMRDLHRMMTGPAYARRCVERAASSGAVIRAGRSITGWAGPLTLDSTGRDGIERTTARAVVLATGARERPRPARLVPGSRPEGVYTTGLLQQTVYLHGLPVGRRAVIVGAEHVSYSAAVALRHAGVAIAAMLTHLPRTQTYRAFHVAACTGYRFPVHTGVTVTELLGHPRLESVAIARADGSTERIDADTIVFTGDWIPDHEVARFGELDIDPGTRGPAVDGELRTSRDGVFAVGNLVHAVETADVAALEGGYVAQAVLRHLAGVSGPRGVAIEVEAPLAWVSPNRVSGHMGGPPLGRFLLWSTAFVRRPTIVVRQGGRVLHARRRFTTIVPNRPISLSSAWSDCVVDGDVPVHINLD